MLILKLIKKRDCLVYTFDLSPSIPRLTLAALVTYFLFYYIAFTRNLLSPCHALVLVH